MKTLGVLRTTADTNYSIEAASLTDDGHGNPLVHSAKIPDRILRNDGYHDLRLVAGYRYHIRRDSVGWLFWREGDRDPHRYLHKEAWDGQRVHADSFELAHTTAVLVPSREYVIESDETGAWRLLESVTATTS